MDKQVKAGDKVTSRVTIYDVVAGKEYEVRWVCPDGQTVDVVDDKAENWYLNEGQWELVQPESAVTAQAGDIVTPLEKGMGFTPGKEYLVTRNDGYADCPFIFIAEDDDADGVARYRPAEEFRIVRRAVTEQPEPQQQDIYLISGFASEFPTLEAAEQRLTDGYGLHGEEYRIAKLVKTVRVSRVTTTTLEAV